MTLKSFLPCLRFCSVITGLSVAGAGAVQAGFLLNPSFEEGYNESFPHYGPVEGWQGGSGTNRAGGPFHNGTTAIPDGTQVAFIQNSNTLSQGVSGLIPGQPYWIQFFYDARNCCGGTIDLVTKWDEVVIDTISGVTPAINGDPYRFRNVLITPEFADATLGLGTLAAGDATVLLDAVTIVPAGPNQVVVMNPSFEASGTPPAPGNLTAAAGWAGSGTGSAGVNDSTGPYADNGTIPGQDHVAFLQGDLTIMQTLRGLTAGESYTLTFRYNAPVGGTPRLSVGVDGARIFDEAVTPVGGNAEYRTGTVNFTAAANTAELSFSQTGDSGQTVLLDEIKLTGVVAEPLPNLRAGPPVLEVGPGTRGNATFTVSADRLETGSSTIVLRIINEAVAQFVNPDPDGTVSLTFPEGAGETTLTAEIEGIGRGVTMVVIEDNGGHDGVDGSIRIECVTSFIKNASFESTAPPPGIGTGLIMGWQNSAATSGINNISMPFLDNGNIPDRAQVAFLQGSQVLSQMVTGLESGQRYALQAWYNSRDCCGGGTIDLEVRFDGKILTTLSQVPPAGGGVPFHFLHAEFTADGTDGLLEFATTAAGDATLLLDAVTMVPFDAGAAIVKNPSFEASGSPTGVGYLTGLAGWNVAGGHGINIDTVGPFSDNGFAGAQDRVGFLQGAASFSQLIEGLTSGATYTLSFLVNARNGDTPGPSPYRVLIDGEELLAEDMEPVGVGLPYESRTIPFIAAGTTVDIAFEGLSPGGEDQSLLLDDIRIISSSAPAQKVVLSITPLAGNSVDIAWPAGTPASLVLQSTTNLATGPWANVTSVPFVEGGFNHVFEVIDQPRKYYRLVQP